MHTKMIALVLALGAVSVHAAEMKGPRDETSGCQEAPTSPAGAAISADEAQKITHNIARLDYAVNVYVNAIRMEKAKQVAFSLVASAGLSSQRFSMYLTALLQDGRREEVLGILQKSYDVPPGHRIDVKICAALIHAFDLDDGRRDLGAFRREQLIKLATGATNGADYTQRLIEIAGSR